MATATPEELHRKKQALMAVHAVMTAQKREGFLNRMKFRFTGYGTLATSQQIQNAAREMFNLELTGFEACAATMQYLQLQGFDVIVEED